MSVFSSALKVVFTVLCFLCLSFVHMSTLPSLFNLVCYLFAHTHQLRFLLILVLPAEGLDGILGLFSLVYFDGKTVMQVLSDDEKRSIYDRYGEAGLKGAGVGTGVSH